MNRNLIKALVGQEISALGDKVFYIAGVFWLYGITGSIVQSSLGTIIGYITGFFLSFFIASIVDNYKKKTLVLFFEIAQTVTFVTLAAICHYKLINIYFIYALQLIVGISSSFLNMANSAWSAQYITGDISKKVNQISTIRSFNSFAFLLIGGLLSAVMSYRDIFLFNAATFFFAFLVESTIEDKSSSVTNILSKIRPVSIFKEAVSTFKTIKNDHPHFFHVSIMAALFNFFSVPLGGLIPFLIKIDFAKGPKEYSQILMASSIAMLFASLAYRKLKDSLSIQKFIAIAFISEAILCLFVPHVKTFYTFAIINFLVVFPIYFINVKFNILLRNIGTSDYSKLKNISESVSSLMIPIGIFLATYSAEFFSPKSTFAFAGILMCACTFFSWAWHRIKS